jgi:uncharacterized protein (DUF885 family)
MITTNLQGKRVVLSILSQRERFIGWPAVAPASIAVPDRATAYMIGYLEIRRLCEKAEESLREAFDLRALQ